MRLSFSASLDEDSPRRGNVAGDQIETKKRIEPMTACRFHRRDGQRQGFVYSPDSRGRRRRRGRRVRSLAKEAPIEFAKRLLLDGKFAAVIIDVRLVQLDQLRHRPVIENRSARVIAAKTFRARGRFADLLSVVEHHRTARRARKEWPKPGVQRSSRCRPIARRGESHFVVILGIAKRIIENEIIALDRDRDRSPSPDLRRCFSVPR